ncbi:ribonuclease H-like domain-containing protein [Tanacetum coccineum]
MFKHSIHQSTFRRGVLGAAPYVLPSAFSTIANRDPTWNIDTGASSHLNSHTSNLNIVYNKCLYPSVCVGDGKSIPVTNTGHSILPTLNRPLHLHNVLVTPNIIKNLIYVRQFTRDNNCTAEFDAFGFLVKDFLTRHILLRCDSSGDLYPVTSPSPTPHALLCVSPSTWHQRLGHPGEDVLRSLKSRQYISYNKEKSSHLCHACQLGKHVRLPFTSSNSIVTRSFEIVHYDIWTSPIASSGGFRYYVLFLDHYSHYLWIYPLRTKSEVFQKFLHFRSYVNNQFKCDIAAFQCDRGERMIRTINNVIRTLLFQAHLSPTFWVEALHMVAYLLNLLPSSAIQNEIPCTKLFKKQPDYSRLRIFGCLCYLHLHSPHKLAPRATPCIFLGYPAYHRGYRCLDLFTNKIIISRHVTFDELQFPYGSITPSQPTSYTFLDPTPSLIHQHIIHNTTQHPTTPHAPITPIVQYNPTPSPTPSLMYNVTPPSAHPDTPPHHNTSQSTTQSMTQPNFAQTTPTSATTHMIPNPPTRTHPMVTRAQVGTVKPNPRFHGHISPIPKFPFVALSDPNWRNAMYDEYNALIKNSTWVLVSKPPNANVVRSMWLFRLKYHADGSLSRYKARLVANGRSQQFGVTFNHVVKPDTVRTVLSLALFRNWLIHQLDVKNAFLNGDLSETVYMYQPPGYANRVGFSSSRCDSSLFIYQHGSEVAYLLIYVDDIVLTASSMDLLQRMFLSQKKYALDLLDRAHMANCNPTRTPVDMESKLGSDRDPISDPTLYRSLAGGLQYLTFTRPNISYTVQQVCLHMHDPQEPHLAALKRVLRYVHGTLDFGLQLYASSTGSLVAYTDADWAGFPTTRSSAEAEYRGVANVVAETDWLRNLLRELHTPLLSTTFVYCDNVRVLHVPSRYQYADIFTKGLPSALFEEFHTSLSVQPSPTQTAGAYSTSGYCVFLGDNLLSWSVKRQHTLSRSSAEAEYRGVANVVAETAWLRNLLRELHSPLSTANLVYCDNVSAVYMSDNPVQHQRMKHIEIDIHFVRDMGTAGQVKVLHVSSRYQYADIFTKGLPSALFKEL